MKKTKGFAIILALGLFAGCVSGCAPDSNGSENATGYTTSESTSESAVSQSANVTTKDDISIARDVQDEIIDTAEGFLRAYLEFDTADNNGVYDSKVIYKQYEPFLSDSGKAVFEPDPDLGVDEVDVSSRISKIKTYTLLETSDTATTVSVLTVDSDVGGMETTANYIYNVMLMRHGDEWLVETILNQSIVDFPISEFW